MEPTRPRLTVNVMLKEITNTDEFYAGLTPLYHLIYPDWDKGMEHQAAMLDGLIREIWGDDTSSILDVSCGIGTQAIGLAKLGYKVTASDLSREEVERAKVEADRRELKLDISVADMRQAFNHHRCEFDLVISCDNSVPHLLTDEDILTAFEQLQRCTRPGGGCLITVRDYEKEDLSKRQVKPYGVREDNGVRWILFQVWDPYGSTYNLTMYFVEDRGGAECRTYALRCSYYAIGIPKLMDLMLRAGFENVRRLDGKFFQPVIIGTRKA
jgi:SAM-dependent methyltransferase